LVKYSVAEDGLCFSYKGSVTSVLATLLFSHYFGQ
jgi:hypothetical protein